MEFVYSKDKGIEAVQEKLLQAKRETMQAQLYVNITDEPLGNCIKPAIPSAKWTVCDYGVCVMTEDELETNYIANDEVYYFVEDFLHKVLPKDVATQLTEQFSDYCDETLDARPLAERVADLLGK